MRSHSRRLGIPALLLLKAFSVAPVAMSAQEPPLAPAEHHDTPLAPGDAIRIAMWREPELNGDYGVDERGLVVLPLLGQVAVAGVELDGLRTLLFDRYSHEIRDPEIEITFLRRVSILGAVSTPGLFHLDPTMGITDALALAGGATSTGRINHTQVMRSGTDVTNGIDLDAPLLRQLQSGDQIYVPQQTWLQRNGIVIVGTTISGIAIIYAATLR